MLNVIGCGAGKLLTIVESYSIDSSSEPFDEHDARHKIMAIK
jgi:hypothetical protein